jgi:hypothetical protein
LKLPRDTRAAIYEANGRPVQIPWPPRAEPPKRGHVYTIQSRARSAGVSTILVLDFRKFAEEEDGEGLLVTVQQSTDPGRSRVSKSTQRHVGGVGTLTTHAPDGRTMSDFTEGEPGRIDRYAEEQLANQAYGRSAVLRAERRCMEEIRDRESEIERARAAGSPTALAEGGLERAKRRLTDVHSPVARRSTPKREPAAPTLPEPPPVSIETVLHVLRDDDAASDIATRLGRPTTKLRSIVSALIELRAQGLVYYRIEVDEDGENPTGRWRHRPGATELGEAA